MYKNKMKKPLLKKLIFWILGLFLLIVLFVIAPKATIGCTLGFSPKALTHTKMSSLKHGLRMFKLDNGNYPTTEEGLEALIVNPNPKKYPNYSRNSYMEKTILDPWKNPFIYINYQTDKGDDFQLISFGADEKYGGEEGNEDIIYPTLKKKEFRFF